MNSSTQPIEPGSVWRKGSPSFYKRGDVAELRPGEWYVLRDHWQPITEADAQQLQPQTGAQA
jgi:hypothetical protein